MNFKLKSSATNLNHIKQYKNTSSSKVNYQYPSENIYDEDEFTKNSFSDKLENSMEKVKEQIQQKLDEKKALENSTIINIPEEMGNGGYTVTVYQEQAWAYDQKEVYDLWESAGANWDNGIAVYDDRYLIACTSTFGNVGDKVDFYLEDGTKIPCIIADIKSQEVVPWDTNPANEWGHKNGANILEFEVLGETFREYGDNPGLNGWFDEWGGQRVVSATNLGKNVIKEPNI